MTKPVEVWRCLGKRVDDFLGWRNGLEKRGMQVSRRKIEYMCVNERKTGGKVNIQGIEIVKAVEFKYLCSTIQSYKQEK